MEIEWTSELDCCIGGQGLDDADEFDSISMRRDTNSIQ